MQKKIKEIQRKPLLYENRKYRYDDIVKTLHCLQQSLLDGMNATIISELSNVSVRRGIALAGRFLSSHKIPDRFLTPVLFSRYIQQEMPVHLFIKALVMGNNVLYKEGGLDSIGNIANIFYTPCDGETYEFSVGYRLLSYLAKYASEDTYIRKLKIQPFRELLYPKLDLDALLKKWLHFGLIKSKEACIADHFDQVESLCLAQAGMFYNASLVYSLSYLECIKDDCDVGDIDLLTVVETKEQIQATLALCDWMIAQEEKELSELMDSKIQRQVTFLQYSEHDPCITYSVFLRLVDEIRRVALREPSLAPLALRANQLLGNANKLAKKIRLFLQDLQK